LDLLADLNDAQREAVTHTGSPLLVVAGAGSGKTRVITRRVAYLIQQGVQPYHILAITFTNKAAGEMRQRVADLGCPTGATICTFHALCARLLREFALEASLPANYSIYDRADQLKLVKLAIEKLDMAGSSGPQPAKVHAGISNAKNELLTVEAYAAKAGDFYSRNVAEVYREYEALLAANGALDFDDLLLRMAFLLRDHPPIRELLGQRYQCVLIDEYQDTNRAQYILAHGIAMDRQDICATGDPDQSIYAWRGADIRNILEFEADYPNATVVRLEENYRSTAPILAVASRLIAHNRQRKAKNLWTRREGGVDVKVVLCNDEHAEAEILAERLAAYHEAGGNWSDLTVFYRVNWLSRVIEEALLRRRIPYVMARGVEFYNRKEIKDVVAYLKLLVNPDDDLACERIINTPARGIGAVTVRRLREYAASRSQSLLWACGEGRDAGLRAAAAKKTAAFAEMIASLSTDLNRPVRKILDDVLSVSGMQDALRNGDEDDRQAYGNVGELINTAAEFDAATEGGSLAEYLQGVSLVSDVDHLESHGDGGGAVTLMTLHAAKGLEFACVFVVGCEDGLLPFERPDQAFGGSARGCDVEEERRLAFVGMTRAKDELTLTCVRQRMVRGQRMSQSPSPFLSEIGADGVAMEDLTTSEPVATRRSAAGPGGPRRGGFYADADERTAIEAAEAEADHDLPHEYEYLGVGCRVHHAKFGPGKVTRIGGQGWPDTRVEVFFEKWGPKKLVLAMAHLELLDDGEF